MENKLGRFGIQSCCYFLDLLWILGWGKLYFSFEYKSIEVWLHLKTVPIELHFLWFPSLLRCIQGDPLHRWQSGHPPYTCTIIYQTNNTFPHLGLGCEIFGVFFSSSSLKTREKYVSFAQFVYFLRKCLYFSIFEW